MNISSKAFLNCCSLSVIEFNDIVENVKISILDECNLPKDFHIVIPNKYSKERFSLFNGINFNKILTINEEKLLQFKKTNMIADIYLAILHLQQIIDISIISKLIELLIDKYKIDDDILQYVKTIVEV